MQEIPHVFWYCPACEQAWADKQLAGQGDWIDACCPKCLRARPRLFKLNATVDLGWRGTMIAHAREFSDDD